MVNPISKPPPREKKPPRGLSKVGRRGKRLAAADKRMAAEAHKEPCVCGCSSDSVHWSHLESRAYESTRHSHLWVPTDPYLTMWLDQHHEGVHCKRHLLELARLKGERLTQEECYPVLEQFGFYSDYRRAMS